MQYRASFLLQSLGQLLVTGIEFLGVLALFGRFGGLAGWSLAEVAFFYGVVNVSFACADALSTGFDRLGVFVRTGELDRMLLRPRSPELLLAGHELALRRVGRLAQGLAVLVWASGALEVAWTPAGAALLLLTIACGTALFLGLFVLQATLAFWTVESLELVNSFTYGGAYAMQYPLAIYRVGFRRFVTFVVPLACVAYFPVLALLGRPDPLGSPPAVQWLAPLAGPAFLLASLAAFRLGLRHYASTGS
jgi:ABC-2 type transport system permease protein